MENDDEITPFSLLPEGCIANIISFTSPKDACRASAVSSGFKLAVESDTIWEQFLPPDIEDILTRSVSLVSYSTKKELYFILSDSHILLDQGKLSFFLNKSNGKKCYMICAKELHITWDDTPQYWKYTSLLESRFSEVAELLAVCWLEIRGIMQSQMLSCKTIYTAYLVFKIPEEGAKWSGLDSPFKAFVNYVKDGVVEVEGEASTVFLLPPQSRRRGGQTEERNVNGGVPNRRRDGWMEIKLGRFFTGKGEEGTDIEMQFLEIERGHWKHQLIVEGIEIRPVEVF